MDISLSGKWTLRTKTTACHHLPEPGRVFQTFLEVHGDLHFAEEVSKLAAPRTPWLKTLIQAESLRLISLFANVTVPLSDQLDHTHSLLR